MSFPVELIAALFSAVVVVLVVGGVPSEMASGSRFGFGECLIMATRWRLQGVGSINDSEDWGRFCDVLDMLAVHSGVAEDWVPLLTGI
jgi:hypothetical protein